MKKFLLNGLSALAAIACLISCKSSPTDFTPQEKALFRSEEATFYAGLWAQGETKTCTKKDLGTVEDVPNTVSGILECSPGWKEFPTEAELEKQPLKTFYVRGFSGKKLSAGTYTCKREPDGANGPMGLHCQKQ